MCAQAITREISAMFLICFFSVCVVKAGSPRKKLGEGYMIKLRIRLDQVMIAATFKKEKKMKRDKWENGPDFSSYALIDIGSPAQYATNMV